MEAKNRLEGQPVKPTLNDHSPVVLVVEDDKYMRNWVEETLREQGFQTVGVGDAMSGVAAILAGSVDAVVTDWRMPGYDGLSFLQSARSLVPGMPVVFTTAYADSVLHQQVRRYGAYCLLEKPFRGADLVRHVRGALERSALPRNEA